MPTLRTLLAGADSAVILCAYTGTVVRSLALAGDRIDLRCPDITVGLDPDKELTHRPWFMDRGDVLIGSDAGTIKLCTVGDILRVHGREDCAIWDDTWEPR